MLLSLCRRRSRGNVWIVCVRADDSEQEFSTGKRPEGMVWIPGGEFSMGAVGGDAEMPMASNDSTPIHRVRVDGFWMDTTPVKMNSSRFAKATGYVTIAERTPLRL